MVKIGKTHVEPTMTTTCGRCPAATTQATSLAAPSRPLASELALELSSWALAGKNHGKMVIDPRRMGFHGISCDFMGFHGISWDFMGFHGILKLFLDQSLFQIFNPYHSVNFPIADL